MQDLYPSIFRITTSLFPSADDDVVTSPYNAMLALSVLSDHASAVLPIENQALLDVVSMVDQRMQQASHSKGRTEDSHLTGKGLLICLDFALIVTCLDVVGLNLSSGLHA
jgi:hypothetical protein